MLNSLSLCGDITESIAFGLFDFSIAPSFLYYFYLPVFFLSLVISIFFLFFAPKNKINKYFLFSILVFSLWQINELVQWVAIHNEIIFFSWQIIAILHPLMVFSVVLLIERLARKYIKNFPVIDDVSILFLSFIPIFVLMSGSYNFVYDISYCEGILGNLWIYIYFIELLLFLNLLYKLIKFRKSFISMKMFTYIFISSLILSK